MNLYWKSFFKGFGSILNIFGTSDIRTPHIEQEFKPMSEEEGLKEDARNIANDWKMVYGDLNASFEKVTKNK